MAQHYPLLSHEQWDTRYRAAKDRLLDVHHVRAMQGRLAHTSAAKTSLPLILAGSLKLGRARRVAVFAGAFNPQTIAHDTVAQAAQRTLELDLVVWAMSRVTVNKERTERASLFDRAIQLDAYVHGTSLDDALIVVDAGLYVDQAASIRELLPSDATLWFVVGFDKVSQIFDRRYYMRRPEALAQLFAMARLLVAPRGGRSRDELRALLAQPENSLYAEMVDYLEVTADVSSIASSRVRAEAAHAEDATAADWMHLLTPEGAALTRETRAYATPTMLPTGEALDAYDLRLRWLAVLESMLPGEWTVHSLAKLMAIGNGSDERAAMVRRWLYGERWPGAPETVKDLLTRK